MIYLQGCKTTPQISTKADLCRLQFDYTDGGIKALNTQNLRVLKSFKDYCKR